MLVGWASGLSESWESGQPGRLSHKNLPSMGELTRDIANDYWVRKARRRGIALQCPYQRILLIKVS
jgi:hypothetical protein